MAARYYLLNASSNVIRKQRSRPNPSKELTEVAFLSEHRLFKSEVKFLLFCWPHFSILLPFLKLTSCQPIFFLAFFTVKGDEPIHKH